jgi:hypothetical protein
LCVLFGTLFDICRVCWLGWWRFSFVFKFVRFCGTAPRITPVAAAFLLLVCISLYRCSLFRSCYPLLGVFVEVRNRAPAIVSLHCPSPQIPRCGVLCLAAVCCLYLCYPCVSFYPQNSKTCNCMYVCVLQCSLCNAAFAQTQVEVGWRHEAFAIHVHAMHTAASTNSRALDQRHRAPLLGA